MKLKPAAYVLILAMILGGLFIAYRTFGLGDKISDLAQNSASTASRPIAEKKERAETSSPKKAEVQATIPSGSSKPLTIKIGVVTWGGYAGGQYWNKGFKANTDSNFYKDYGFLVEFRVIDDFNTSRDAWKSGDIDLLWVTADSFPTESEALARYEPKIVFQSDWSRGGDVIVANRGINKINDLAGKKVAVALGTPSHTFLIKSLEMAGLPYNSITVVEAPSAIDSAEYFKAGSVDAAVVWSPDDEAAIEKVPGAKRLVTTKDAAYIIADVFFAKKSFIDSHSRELTQLIEGWMKGAAELNQSEAVKRDAAKILERGMNMPFEFCLNAINNVRLATYGDNVAFFGIDRTAKTVRGEDIYSEMARKYREIHYIKGVAPNWNSVVDLNPLRDVSLSPTGVNSAERMKTFEKASVEEVKKESFVSKALSISFASNSSELSADAMSSIDRYFVKDANAFPNARIRVEGNTDSVGSPDMNVALSFKRAQAVVNYLVRNHNFDPNRFIVIGNGPKKPIADNTTAEGRAQNRRTDFELIN